MSTTSEKSMWDNSIAKPSNSQQTSIAIKNKYPDPILQIMLPYKQGINCIFLNANLQDFDLNNQSEIQKLTDILQEYARLEHGLAIIQYSLSTGIYFDTHGLSSAEVRNIENILSAHNLTGLSHHQNSENEFTSTIRAINNICRNTNHYQWDNEKPLRFLFLIQFAEHLLPNDHSNYLTDNQKTAVELCSSFSTSLDLRTSENYIVFNSTTSISENLLKSIHQIQINYPNAVEKQGFITQGLNLYKNANLEQGLDVPIIANLTANTPNYSIERIARASHRTNTPISAQQINKQREQDIIAISEGTLSVLNKDRVKKVELKGINVQVALNVLKKAAIDVKNSILTTHANYLLFGAPGVGKTDMAIIAANESGLPAYSLESPKGGIVGETERRTRLQMQVLQSHKNIAFSDEFSEKSSTSRGDSNLDAGSSASVLAGLLTFLSDKSRQGHNLFIGTSNCPWRIDDALMSRCICLPVLMPLETDYAEIILAIAHSIDSNFQAPISDKHIQEAAKIFYTKSASPRDIVTSLNIGVSAKQCLNASIIRDCAYNLCSNYAKASSIYADLWALKVTTDATFLPWFQKPNYQFPLYIQKVVGADGFIIQSKINDEIKALKPYVNI